MEQDVGDKRKTLMSEALKSKDLEDEYNVLMFAAAFGWNVSFPSLTRVIRRRVRMTSREIVLNSTVGAVYFAINIGVEYRVFL